MNKIPDDIDEDIMIHNKHVTIIPHVNLMTEEYTGPLIVNAIYGDKIPFLFQGILLSPNYKMYVYEGKIMLVINKNK